MRNDKKERTCSAQAPVHYAAAIRALERLTVSRGIKPGLERITELLTRLGDPQSSFPSVHVAGTNGKGTVVRMLSTGCTACGLKTGEYTSPHLVSYRERFVVDGHQITEREFTVLFSYVSGKARGITGITEFELLTAMAFEFFRRHDVDIAVLETGLGGRFDATNVVTPLCSVITSIGYDHQNILGRTLKKIAFEKAGIIKTGIPVVIGQLPPVAKKEVLRISKRRGSPVIQARTMGLKVRMLGTQQGINVGIACAVRDAIDRTLALPKRKFISGVHDAYLPGRLQLVRRTGKPLLILDGGHNEEASALLARNLRSLFPRKEKTFVVGILKRKDARSLLKNIALIADVLVLTAPSREFHGVKALAAILKGLSLSSRYNLFLRPQLSKAINQAMAKANKDGLICVTGSFYLLGELATIKKFSPLLEQR